MVKELFPFFASEVLRDCMTPLVSLSAYRMFGSCGRVRPAISAQKFLSSLTVIPCHGAVFLGSEKNRRNLCPSSAC